MPKSYVIPAIQGNVYRTPLTGGAPFHFAYATIASDAMTVTATSKRAKPKDLWGATTARSVQRDTFQAATGVWRDSVYVYSGPCSAIWSVGAEPATGVFPALNTLDGRMRSKIKAQNVNLAQSIAEYRQTSKMFADLANDVVKTFRSFRSGRVLNDLVRGVSRPRDQKAKAIANRWLQYQYGLRPAMSDVYGSAEALASKIRDGMYLYHTVRAKEEKRTKTPYQNVGFSQRIYTTYEHEWQGKCRARYKVSDPTMKQLAQIGISNPLLLAWELVPYSFVIDWLIPIGNWLGSLDALVGVSDLRVARSQRYKRVWTCYTSAGNNEHIQTLTQRQALDSTLQMPQLVYRPSTSFKALTNGVALLTQLRK